jgi:preprotein translocase subunit SecA
MAGRGTDIVLGGNLEMEINDKGETTEAEQSVIQTEWQRRHDAVIVAGGLHVLGTERHESRRVDNQLRGRCGRQGDPGSSAFYVAMEDGLMRIFGSERVSGLMEKLGMEEGEAIEHPWVTKAIENAQKKVEGRNFDIRKQLLEYDDVANEQRKVIYDERKTLMAVDDISEMIMTTRSSVVNSVIDRHIVPQSIAEQWDIPSLEGDLENEFGLPMSVDQWLEQDSELHEETLRGRIVDEIAQAYQAKADSVGEPVLRHLEKAVMLRVLDEQWKEHLSNMDHLRQGIGLRGYAQKNPKQEYKREAFEMFTSMLDGVKHEVITILSKIQIQTEAQVTSMEEERRSQDQKRHEYLHPDTALPSQPSEEEVGSHSEFAANSLQASPPQRPTAQPFIRSTPKVGRNEPCPCGSGRKYKHCHGKL